MTAHRHRRRHRAGHRQHRPAQLPGMPRGVQRPGAVPGLDHQRRRPEGRNQPIPAEETLPVRRAARRSFADQQALLGGAVIERGMPGRIRTIQAAGRHQHRFTVGGQHPAMRGRVDAVRAAGDHRHARAGTARRRSRRRCGRRSWWPSATRRWRPSGRRSWPADLHRGPTAPAAGSAPPRPNVSGVRSAIHCSAAGPAAPSSPARNAASPDWRASAAGCSLRSAAARSSCGSAESRRASVQLATSAGTSPARTAAAAVEVAELADEQPERDGGRLGDPVQVGGGEQFRLGRLATRRRARGHGRSPRSCGRCEA